MIAAIETSAPIKAYSGAVLCDLPKASNHLWMASGTASTHGNGILCASSTILPTSP